MNRTIQMKFFSWISLHTLVTFLIISVSVIFFNAHEVHEKEEHQEHSESQETSFDEAVESMTMVGLMVVLFPVCLLSAWYISRRLLLPWKKLTQQARRIGDGDLDERIKVENPDDEIGELSLTLNEAFSHHQDLLARVRRFGFDAAHQLRNPMAVIRMGSEICLNKERTPAEYQLTLQKILKSSLRLNRTIDQLLMLAHVTQTPPKSLKTVCLQEVAQQVITEGQAFGELREIHLQMQAPEQPVRIQGAPDLLHEALANLVDNAVRYSPENSTIELEIGEVSLDHVRILLRDSGPGLSPEQKELVFQPFKQRQAESKGSVGLGLAIVADVCQIHQGRFGVEDNPGGGSIFWIELPVDASETALAPETYCE
jgi:two-component system OmpR family sensor kinase